MASAAAPAATLVSAAVTPISGSRTKKRVVKYIPGLNSYGGLKAQTMVLGLGVPVCTEQCFAKVVSSLKTQSRARGGRGGRGALSSTCNAAAEIFRIAAIMNGLVLVGVAVGFVLLRLEAALEESE